MADLRRPRRQAGQGRQAGSDGAAGNSPLHAHALGTYRPAMSCLGRPTRMLLVAAALGLAFLGGRWGLAQRPGQPAAMATPAGQLWIQATPIDDRQQLVLVLDPQLRSAAVYHLDHQAGTLALKSTRNITWDLLVGDFNAQEPKPAALRRLLEVGAEAGPIGQNPP